MELGNGFGLLANYTHVDLEIDYIDPSNQIVDTTNRVFVFHYIGRELLIGARYALR